LIRIGSRGSLLARWQAEHVQALLAARGHECRIHLITTTGDRVQDRRLESVGGKGAFLKEIEEAMLAGEVDLAVHSLKDVPTALPEGLRLCAVLERADPRDALVSAAGVPFADLPAGSTIGTSSLRRQCQVRALRPDLAVADLRGNVDTRLQKLRDGRCHAIVLALAGLTRLGRADEATEALDPDTFVPAPGQGAIALECRTGDATVAAAVAPLHDARTASEVEAERSLLQVLGGGCNVPLGAYATTVGPELRLVAFVGRADGSSLVRGERRGSDPVSVGRGLADDLLARGAAALLAP
jgi:hydroxymethylbilane synthase